MLKIILNLAQPSSAPACRLYELERHFEMISMAPAIEVMGLAAA
jgi:hypothetical protein